MRAYVTVGLFALVLALGSSSMAAESTADEKSLHTVTVDQLATLRTSRKAVIVDANNGDTRQKYGVIPGAILLSHYEKYDVAKELPRDHAEKLVFYCANEKCMASHKAAARATEAGYTDVSVLPAGIMGWKSSGQPIDTSGS